MSKLTKSIAALVVVLFVAHFPARADGPGWVQYRTIVNIVDVASGGINVRLSPDLTGCTSQSGYGQHYASVYPDHPAINRIKATLLTAFVTGKTVSVYLVDNTCKVYETVIGPY
jgi:hypothetical protein